MSEWRQRGFVQDSDEEVEESQIESQHSEQDVRSYGRVKHLLGAQDRQKIVESAVHEDQRDFRSAHGASDRSFEAGQGGTGTRTPTRRNSITRPTPSPLAPTTRPTIRNERTESPDPLQSTPKFDQQSQAQASSSPHVPSSTRQRSSQDEIELRAYALPSQILGETTEPIQEPSRVGGCGTGKRSDCVGQFGISALSDHSEDELNPSHASETESNLSDYPSDLSDVEPEPAVQYAPPHRQTAVQVVIPPSIALQQQLAQEEARRRHFRQRKPIQLHPYVLEGERYRREVQSRGLKPVPRERSPQQKQRQDYQETQEEEFNPLRDYSSSPPDPEIFVSTPTVLSNSKNGPRNSSTKRPRSDLAQSDSPTLQLRVPKSAKRRRHRGPLAQALVTPARTSESSPVPVNIWSVPLNSPPYSSSPLLSNQASGIRATRNGDSLPTPSDSSTLHDEAPRFIESDSDSDPIPNSVRRSGTAQRTTRSILGDDLSSDSEAARSASEPEEGELQKVGRKIRGVLPASWLRIDQQAQEQRQAFAVQRARMSATQALESAEPQRGVAQRVVKSTGRPTGLTRPAGDASGVVVISDDSDPDDAEFSGLTIRRDAQGSMEDSSALATLFDSRYADFDDDLIGMEHDRLQLPTLGGFEVRRKRQPKIADALGTSKRRKELTGVPKPSRLTQPTSAVQERRTEHRSSHRTTPLALSVMDIELPVHVPQFLRLARRAARKDVNLARQSPRRKQIRLHTARDTEDANAALEQWRKGLLRPMKPAAMKQHEGHPLLVDTTDNPQHASRTESIEAISIVDVGDDSNQHMAISKPRRRKAVPPALRLLQRIPNPNRKRNGHKKVAKRTDVTEKMIQRGSLPHRAAQLESDEGNFGRAHRKIAFHKGLQRAEQSYLNPQLARFLADDDIVLPPLPTREDVGEAQTENTTHKSASSTAPVPRKRIIRKPQTQRIDVDAREYRQPSEPAFSPLADITVAYPEEAVSMGESVDVLHGLGPFGARYPTTFDITPMKSDVYFHADTFVGSEDLRRALSVGKPESRDLDDLAGYCTVSYGPTTIRCGPWNDETYSQIFKLMTTPLLTVSESSDHKINAGAIATVLTSLTSALRALVSYVSCHLSFLDPIDRADFTRKIVSFLQTVSDRVFALCLVHPEALAESEQTQSLSRILSCLLVLCVQVHQISEHLTSNNMDKATLLKIIKTISQHIIKCIGKSTKALFEFHERNKLYKEREGGIQEHDGLVESVVVSMHALEALNAPALSFWGLISQELSSHLTETNHVHVFESIWATIFALLPFAEFDSTGIPDRSRTQSFDKDNWDCLCDVLRRVLRSYRGTSQQQGSSINDYIRVNLIRCYILINDWHWKRPDQALNVVFDFYGKHGLRPLCHETVRGSAQFLQNFTSESSLVLSPTDSSFHISLKCLATGLQGMRTSYSEKKVRSFVFRRIPNHGRTYPKDQLLEQVSLDALRNHHDLLSTLYCAAPPSCRPRLDRIRDLVSHETSHREACRVSVRTWANLAAFQLSTDEPYDLAKPFAHWHRDIMHQTLKQYRLAKTEAENYLTSGAFDGTSEVAKTMVRQAMAKNQEQAIATLRDGIVGMKKAVEAVKDQVGLAAFLGDSDFIQLLELPHLDDHRLVRLIRDTLVVVRQFICQQSAKPQHQVSQPASEESQDYGDFPDLDDLDDNKTLQPVQATNVPISPHDVVQGSLWHLMSNAFGAECMRDNDLLMDCVDTWVAVASAQVTISGRHWSSYCIDTYAQVSWQQLRRTEHTTKFGPYFMASVITCDSSVYNLHRNEFLTELLLCLAERESMLKFQHRLLDVIVRTDPNNTLLRNLPFYRAEPGGGLDINFETLRSRRLALISSLLFNMREDVYATAIQEPPRVSELKKTYAAMLTDFMNRLKSNYQQLQQGDAVTGAYVEFVQKIVQFLTQYTSDICSVIPFFTDSVAFPLPSTDPTYVVGRLCGYAPKAQDLGTAKQLSFFVQTITQQAAADNQQAYLLGQLKGALCTAEVPLADRAALSTVLLQSVFPAYIEVAFSSQASYLVARPILQCLPAVLGDIIFHLRISQHQSLSTAAEGIVAIAHAFIRGTEHLKGDLALFHQAHISEGLAHMYNAAMTILRLLDYIMDLSIRVGRPSLVTYLEEFSTYTVQMLNGTIPDEVPSYRGDADTNVALSNAQYADILAFSRSGLQSSLEANWSAAQGSIWFGQGRTKKQVVYDANSFEIEKTGLMDTIQAFQDTVHELVGAGYRHQIPPLEEGFVV